MGMMNCRYSRSSRSLWTKSSICTTEMVSSCPLQLLGTIWRIVYRMLPNGLAATARCRTVAALLRDNGRRASHNAKQPTPL